MSGGTLEVLVVGAKGLEDTDFLSDMDPYVIVTCGTETQKSSVASGQGTEPKWNKVFNFTVSDDTSELTIKIMDSDIMGEDDFVGKAIISLKPLFMSGSIPPAPYIVVNMDQEYKGEIKVGLTLINLAEETEELLNGQEEEDYGGWKQSCC